MGNIGDRLKGLRKSKRMTLKQVAEKTNLSISFLSQVEHSKCSITIESLMKISEALDVKPSFFFSENEENEMKNISINKQESLDDRRVIANFAYEDLSGNFPGQTFLPTIVTLQPRKEGVRPMPHRGQEFIFVLDGVLTVIFEKSEVSLNVGESIHMESTVPHNWINKSDQAVKFLYVSSR